VTVRNRERPRGRGGSGTCPCSESVIGSVIALIKRHQPECYLSAACQPPTRRCGFRPRPFAERAPRAPFRAVTSASPVGFVC
jgi:hypothetical protein